MASARGTTTAAIVFGAFVGTLAALMSGPEARREPPARPDVTGVMAQTSAPPRAQATHPPPVGTPAPRAAPAPPPSVAPALGSARALPAPDETSELDRLEVAELEKRCAFRQPAACSASARAFEIGRGTKADAAKARLYRSLALSLLDERCLARDAEACHELSLLHERGLGVKANPETAAALRRRAAELCTGKTSAFCGRVGTSPGDLK